MSRVITCQQCGRLEHVCIQYIVHCALTNSGQKRKKLEREREREKELMSERLALVDR